MHSCDSCWSSYHHLMRLHSLVQDHHLWPSQALAVPLVDNAATDANPREHPTLTMPPVLGHLSLCLPAAGVLCLFDGLPHCLPVFWGVLPVGETTCLLAAAGVLCTLPPVSLWSSSPPCFYLCWGALSCLDCHLAASSSQQHPS